MRRIHFWHLKRPEMRETWGRTEGNIFKNLNRWRHQIHTGTHVANPDRPGGEPRLDSGWPSQRTSSCAARGEEAPVCGYLVSWSQVPEAAGARAGELHGRPAAGAVAAAR